MLRRADGTAERHGEAIADRSDHDDASFCPPKEWEERLRHRDLTFDVDGELLAKLFQWNELEGPSSAHTGVVDERVEPSVPDMGVHGAGGLGDFMRRRDIHENAGHEPLRCKLERRRVFSLSNGGEHMKAFAAKSQRRRTTDSGRRTRYDDVSIRTRH